MKKNKKIWIILGCVAAGIAVLIIFLSMPRPVEYKTVKIEKGPISSWVSSTGRLNAANTVEVGSEVGGYIKCIYVDYNSAVKKGQPLIQLDTATFKANLIQQDASLDMKKFALRDAKNSYERNKKLFEKNLIAQVDLDQARSSYENAQSQLKQQQISYDSALDSFRKTTIKAPIDGVVVNCPLKVGNYMSANSSDKNAITIARDLENMQVEANVDEADIGNVKEGQPVSFTVDAFPNRKFEGYVSQVRLSAEVVQTVVTYFVIISVSNEELILKPGMTANLNIVTNQRDAILKVPNAALRFRPPTGSKIAKGFDASGKKTETKKKTKTAGAAKQEKKTEEKKEAPAAKEKGRKPSQEEIDAARKMRMELKAQRDRAGERENRRGGEKTGTQKTDTAKKSPAETKTIKSASSPAQQAGEEFLDYSTLWVQNKDASLAPLNIKTGLTDGAYTEVGGPGIKEGQEIIVGVKSGKESSRGPFGMWGRRH